MTWLGLDIGGANLKAADGRGWARSVPFALWRDPHGLSAALAGLIETAPAAAEVAITMTGELCDCFRTKADGVRHILAAVHQAAGGREILVYLVDGRLVSIEQAEELPQLVAASNWHALARYVCRYVEGSTALLIDIGSTTTDIVQLVDGEPRPKGLTDTDRLLAGELVYTGVGRTPICAITRWLPWRGGRCPVAAELFATTADAYMILGDLPEQQTPEWTADGRPLTRGFARERLARMVCADASTFSLDDAQRAADCVRNAQFRQLAGAVDQVVATLPLPPDLLVLSGVGEFLAKGVGCAKLPSAKHICLSQRLGTRISACGPAHALAVIAGDGQEIFECMVD